MIVCVIGSIIVLLTTWVHDTYCICSSALLNACNMIIVLPRELDTCIDIVCVPQGFRRQDVEEHAPAYLLFHCPVKLNFVYLL